MIIKDLVILKNINAVLFFTGVLVAQRFTLQTLSAYACLIPLILLTVPSLRLSLAYTLSLIALLASVDLGGNAFTETSGVLRYLLYAGLAALILSNKLRFSSYLDLVWIIYLVLLVINTIIHPHALDAYTLFRDLITILLCYAIYFRSKPDTVQPIDYGLFGWFSAGVIFSELLNVVFFYKLSSGDYLNYSSFKFLVAMPFFYLLLNQKYIYAFLVGALTLFVLGAYASRMLMLTFLGIALVILLRDLLLLIKLTTALIMTVVVTIVYFVIEGLSINLDAFRVFTVFTDLVVAREIDALSRIDPIRFIENSIFFSQNAYAMLIGNGLGSGIFDSDGQFAFVPDDGRAFSSTELNEGHFFRLHDSWTWFGYRIGLLPYILFVGWALKGVICSQPRAALAAALMLLAMLNSSFSIGGLFVSAAFALQYRREVAIKVKPPFNSLRRWSMPKVR